MPMKELRNLEMEVLTMIPTPALRRLSFDPAQPSGAVRDSLGDASLNIGVSGLLVLAACADAAKDWQLERLLDDASVCNLREWLPLYHHISHGTVPSDDRPEERAMLAHEYERNRDTYERLGFPPPVIG